MDSFLDFTPVGHQSIYGDDGLPEIAGKKRTVLPAGRLDPACN